MKIKHYSQKLSPETERNGKQPQSLPVIYAPQPEEEDEGGLNLGQLLAALRRRILIVASVTSAVAAAAVVAALNSTPTYEAKFELLTEPVTAENKVISTLPEALSNAQEDSTSVVNKVDETELRILQSHKIMSPLIKQIEARYPGSNLSELNLHLIENTDILEVVYRDPNPEKVQFVLDQVSNAYLKYSLEERQTDIRQGIEFVESQLPQLQERVEILQGRLQNFRQKYDMIDAVGQGEQLSSQSSAIAQQRQNINAQLAKTKALYTALRNQLRLQPNEAVAASVLSEAPRYQKLLDELQEVERKIAVESARYREDSPTVQALIAQRQNLLPLVKEEERRVLAEKQFSTVTDPRGLASQNSIRLEQIKQFLDTARQMQALEAESKSLAQAESSIRQQVRQFPALVRQNNDLERQLKIAADNLSQFLTKREALRIDAAQKQVPWQLLTPPTDPQPSSVSIKRNLVLGTILGLLLGIGLALLLDNLNNIFYTSKVVKDTTKLPILAEIPLKQEHIKQEPNKLEKVAGITGLIQWVGHNLVVVMRGKHSGQQNNAQFWESLHSLYTNIRFVSFDTPIRSLSILSSAPEDGRSTIALHLAQTAAAMGQRVLLVDADLRHPQLHTMLGLPNTKGLSNVIAEDLDFQNVIQRSYSVSVTTEGYMLSEANNEGEFPLDANLFVLTAGQVPPNPTSLLSSPKMQNLAVQLQAAFDLIVYDTPPLVGIADGSLLAARTDASILVVRLGKTNRSTLLKALEGVKISSTSVLGAVTNGIKA